MAKEAMIVDTCYTITLPFHPKCTINRVLLKLITIKGFQLK